jgi:hypothetical protein
MITLDGDSNIYASNSRARARLHRLTEIAMYTNQIHVQERDYTVFTVNVAAKIYRCPISPAALYMLCRGQDAEISQVDAYLQLKMKVERVVEHLLKSGLSKMPAVITPHHVNDFLCCELND